MLTSHNSFIQIGIYYSTIASTRVERCTRVRTTNTYSHSLIMAYVFVNIARAFRFVVCYLGIQPWRERFYDVAFCGICAKFWISMNCRALHKISHIRCKSGAFLLHAIVEQSIWRTNCERKICCHFEHTLSVWNGLTTSLPIPIWAFLNIKTFRAIVYAYPKTWAILWKTIHTTTEVKWYIQRQRWMLYSDTKSWSAVYSEIETNVHLERQRWINYFPKWRETSKSIVFMSLCIIKLPQYPDSNARLNHIFSAYSKEKKT